MFQRLITLAVWALLGWTLMLLGLRLLPASPPSPAPALAPEAPAPASWTRLFGSQAVPAEPVPAAAPGNARFRLIGVVAPRSPQLQGERGVALLSIDGGPPKAFRVGDVVEGELRLLAVEPRAASLGEGRVAQFQLSLSELPPASTGSLPSLPPPVPAMPVLAQPAPPPDAGAQGGIDQSGPRRPPPEAAR